MKRNTKSGFIFNLLGSSLLCLFMFINCNHGHDETSGAGKRSKILYIVRHAKSSWKDASIPDFERPLNDRGKNDAETIGKILDSLKIYPDVILSSPAKRAISTAKVLAKKINYSKENIITNKDIYEASLNELMNIIEQLDDDRDKVMLVGHNPSFTTLVNYLAGENFDNIPTCGVAGIEFEISSWKMITNNSGKLLFFEYPKKYTQKREL